MEESNERIRRNFMVISAFIIVYAIGGVPFNESIQFGLSGIKLKTWAFWATIGVWFIYAWYRYRITSKLLREKSRDRFFCCLHQLDNYRSYTEGLYKNYSERIGKKARLQKYFVPFYDAKEKAIMPKQAYGEKEPPRIYAAINSQAIEEYREAAPDISRVSLLRRIRWNVSAFSKSFWNHREYSDYQLPRVLAFSALTSTVVHILRNCFF